jgi:hypothetical protein
VAHAPAVSSHTARIPLLAFALGAAVAVVLGVNDRRHPSSAHLVTLGFDSVLAMKTWLALGIGVLVLLPPGGGRPAVLGPRARRADLGRVVLRPVGLPSP